MHSHGPAYFSLVLSGGYEERIGSETRQVNGPVILFHPPEEDHAVRFAPVATHILGIEVAPELTQRAKEGRLPVGQGQRHGLSITEYIRKRRFELAVSELQSNRFGLAEVASKLGYADQAHFTREFKRASGVTPGVFRKTYSQG